MENNVAHVESLTIQQEEGLGKLPEIAESLYQQAQQSSNQHGLLNGRMGMFWFLYAYNEYISEESRYALVAEEMLMETINVLYRQPNFHYRDAAELGTMILYLQQRDYLDSSFDEVLEKIDGLLSQAIDPMLKQGNFDTFSGYLPIARYFLKRPNRQGKKILDTVLKNLACIREISDHKSFYRSRLFDSNQVYLGWGHGLAGILLLLGQLKDSEALPTSSEAIIDALLQGITAYLLAHRQNSPTRLYPDIAGEPGIEMPMNLCYGDAGVAYSIWQSGMALNDTALASKGMRDLLLIANRRQPKLIGINDASLMYGSTGISLLFKQVHEHTGNVLFNDAATFWYNTSLAFSRQSNATAGFARKTRNAQPLVDCCLSEGLAGYGLSIMTYHGCDIELLPTIGY
ncbi:lanthionine synthetase LanC family protein [Deminuibacter soli]|uniref:Lanthionine synthetase C family protein n=1 Tax=Deminuibacter soli TaxID=2291815 RepID=A0A3E1NRI2_9BACT|nr:lanthionine synthetase LanC family protein [Deminuibacter soli]RFM30535.1 hypothetical protein DXN05_06160 [Deminuibacter soli]